ncbi:MAG: hypothetical protein ACE10A_07855, partial [Acidiferrobacterales bacterium]
RRGLRSRIICRSTKPGHDFCAIYQAAEKTIFSSLIERCMEAPHIFQTPEVFEKWSKTKTALLLCELKKAMEGLFQHLPSLRVLM